jgi:hypothetical protein
MIRYAALTLFHKLSPLTSQQIFDKYPELINEAIQAAPDTAQKWGAHRSEGGLCKWSLRDRGIFTDRYSLGYI